MQRYNCKDTRMSINKMFCVCFAAVLLTTGCSTDKANEWFVTHNGNMPSNERIAQISVGDTRDEVSRVLGAPSSVVSFDKNTWIYMSSDVRRIAFFAPEEINRDVLTIKFNDEGEVVAVNRLNKQNGQEIAVKLQLFVICIKTKERKLEDELLRMGFRFGNRPDLS